MRVHLRVAAVVATVVATVGAAAVATAQPQAGAALRQGETSQPFAGTIGKGPVAERGTFTMRVVHKLASGRSFVVRSGAPKRVSEIAVQQIPVVCGEGEDAFRSAVTFSLPKAYRLRGRNLNASARFKAVRSFRDDLSGRQLRVVMRGKLTRRGTRARGTIDVVSRSVSGGSACRAKKAPWSGRRTSG